MVSAAVLRCGGGSCRLTLIGECHVHMEGFPTLPTLLRSLEGHPSFESARRQHQMTGDHEPTNKVITTLEGKYVMV